MGWSGPLTGRHFADLGADVIKVEGARTSTGGGAGTRWKPAIHRRTKPAPISTRLTATSMDHAGFDQPERRRHLAAPGGGRRPAGGELRARRAEPSGLLGGGAGDESGNCAVGPAQAAPVVARLVERHHLRLHRDERRGLLLLFRPRHVEPAESPARRADRRNHEQSTRCIETGGNGRNDAAG